MELDPKQCYQALKNRDPRFDGRFYICILSTGIYCRPVCSAKTSKFENCRFVKTAAEAESRGFRPCLRCRPETAPGSPAWLGTGATITRALKLFSFAASDIESINKLAGQLGISDRHLRRIFKEKLGVSPIKILRTERFAIARQLLTGTTLSMSDVAFSSGFKSVRGFNNAIRNKFHMSPGNFRTKYQRPANVQSLESDTISSQYSLQLGFRPPMAWRQMLSYLKTRSIRYVECVDHQCYQRTIQIDDLSGLLSVCFDNQKNKAVVKINMEKPVMLINIVPIIRDMFDLDCFPQEVVETLSTDLKLRSVIGRYPGLRIPGCWSLFELCIRAVIGQQISIKGAQTILGRLVENFGKPVRRYESQPKQLTKLFPIPHDILNNDISGLGLTVRRAQTIQNTAEAFVQNPNFIHRSMNWQEARKRLLSIKGVGPWTADYIILRGLKNPDAFPVADLGLLKSYNADSSAKLQAIAEKWRPWRGYAAMYLWASLGE